MKIAGYFYKNLIIVIFYYFMNINTNTKNNHLSCSTLWWLHMLIQYVIYQSLFEIEESWIYGDVTMN